MLLRAVVLAGLAAFSTNAAPRALATAQDGGVIVTFYDDDCQLTASVVNMPKRAVWTEGGKDVEGCYNVRPDAGIILMYFADKTVGIAPLSSLRKVTNI